jgi:hypothetical protein
MSKKRSGLPPQRLVVGDTQMSRRVLAKSGQEFMQGSIGLTGGADPAVAYQAGEGLLIDAAGGRNRTGGELRICR